MRGSYTYPREEDKEELTQKIKAEALRLGFSSIGMAQAEPISPEALQRYSFWLEQDKHGTMSYMAQNIELRADPRKLFPNARTIIMLALNYYPKALQDNHYLGVSYYAYGRDYHKVIKKKLNLLLDFIKQEARMLGFSPEGRAFVDSAPLMERYWAEKAGLGWIGKSGLLIIPHKGTYFFLGALLLDLELSYDEPMKSRCGSCQKCITACPTQAIAKAGYEVDARRCISYLTIEAKHDIDRGLLDLMGNRFFGCDECSKACPWNRFKSPTEEPDFEARKPLLSLERKEVLAMSFEKFDRLTQGSPMRRAGLDRWKYLAEHLNQADLARSARHSSPAAAASHSHSERSTLEKNNTPSEGCSKGDR